MIDKLSILVSAYPASHMTGWVCGDKLTEYKSENN